MDRAATASVSSCACWAWLPPSPPRWPWATRGASASTPTESTALVTGGPFQVVRNPIYAAMIPTCLGFVLLVPNALAIAAWLALVVGLELHVRRVEEPYLQRVHGRAYAEYAARVGRFLPGMGRLAP